MSEIDLDVHLTRRAALDVHLTRRAALDALVDRLDLERKVLLLTGADFWTLHPLPEIGLDALVLSDGPVGVRGTAADERDPSLLLPNPTTLAATWDPDRVRALGGLVGADARRKGVHVLLAPTIGLHRSPLGGRNFESWSEDPLVTGTLAGAFVAGVQSQGVGATAKHLVLNDTETERLSYEAEIADDVLHELYLRPFRDLVTAGVWLAMAAYNRYEGAHLTEHRGLLTDLLKGAWGFDGVVVSDWYATHATEASAQAGLDLAMPGPDGPWGEALVDAARAGRVEEAVIDDKVRRLLRLAARTGALDGCPPLPPALPLQGAEKALRAAAAAGAVLLTNDGTLPLRAEDGATVALLGAYADRISAQGGGSAHVEPAHVVQPLEALAARLGERLRHEPGPPVHPHLAPLPIEACATPGGEPGLHLEILDADGAVLRQEVRSSASLAFFGDLPPGAARLRYRTTLTPAATGRAELAVRCAGSARLTLDGRTVLDVDLALADPVEALMRPPEARAAVDLTAGAPVEIEAILTPSPALGQPIGTYALGYAPPGPDEEEALARAVDAARHAEVAVVVVGTTDDVESEGFDRTDLALPGRQDELVAAIAAVNARTVVVLNVGAPYELPWADDVAAILHAGFGGQEAGAAIADVLLGAAEPAGRLTTSWPVTLADAIVAETAPTAGVQTYAEGHGIGYRGHLAGGPPPRFWFGHGLGWTTWSYEGARLVDDGAALEVDVANDGERAGREIVQVYLEPTAGVTRLVGFAAAEAGPGERTRVRVPLDVAARSRWRDGRWQRLGGGTLHVGRSAGDLRLTLPVPPTPAG